MDPAEAKGLALQEQMIRCLTLIEHYARNARESLALAAMNQARAAGPGLITPDRMRFNGSGKVAVVDPKQEAQKMLEHFKAVHRGTVAELLGATGWLQSIVHPEPPAEESPT